MKWMNQSKFSELCGVSRMAVSKAVKRGTVIKAGKLGIDVDHPVNASYLQSQNNSRTRRDASGERPGPKKAEPKLKPLKKAGPKQKTLPPASNKAINIEDLDESELYQLLDMNGNLDGIDRPTADLRLIIERIREKELKREQARGLLIDRKEVSKFMNRLYKIDTGELLTISDKLGPAVAAICGVDDPKIIHEVSKEIEEEVYKSQAHIKRLMNDYLKGIKAEALEE